VAKHARKSHRHDAELVVITGLSGSGKATALKAFEDLGYYAVDNMPIELIPKFAELAKDSSHVRRAALVIDIREGEQLAQFPALLERLRRRAPATLVYLEADDATLARRFSETRRPHPLGTGASVMKSVKRERELLAPIREVANHIIDTSKFNVHELREVIGEKFSGGRSESSIRIDINSFGYRHGVPPDSDLVFDVRFLPNPNYIPAFKNLTGRHPSVALPADAGIYRPHLGAVGLPDPALHSRREELPDDRVRLHGRASSLGDDRGGNSQTSGARGVQGEGDAPGYR